MAENNPFKSEYEPIIWSNNGVDSRVRIIDPNPLGEIVPHEDLFIYVSLKAKQRSKTLLTETQSGGITIENYVRNTVDLTVPQKTVESVDGSKLFSNVSNLSTEWTEIGGSPFKEKDLGKDFEGFGITNIDIEIKSQTNPKVTIDFIDVRGATLMEQGSCSPYGLFFNLPYPVFTLTLKGYYGRPATYYLNLIKFTSKFNSDTGNIECRGEFIGWTFGFLSDLMVSYASASQYLNESLYRPQAILKRKYEESWQYYKDSGFVPQDEPNPFCNIQKTDGTTRCKTIKDFLTDNDYLSKNTLPDIKGSFEFTELNNLQKLRELVGNYSVKIDNLEKELREKIGQPTLSTLINPSGKQYNLRFLIPNLTGNTAVTGTQVNLDEVKKILDTYFNKNTGHFSLSIRDIKNLEIKGGVRGFEIIGDYPNALLTKATNEQLSTSEGSKQIYNVLEEEKYKNNFQNGLLTSDYPKAGIRDGSAYWIDLGILKESIENDIKAVDSEIDKRRTEVIKDINSKIEAVIGFKPTIRNIFTVILCNCDAFMEILKEVSFNAEKHHDSEGLKPTPGVLLSGKKVYSWPTYMESQNVGTNARNSKATKEVYPGNKLEYTSWPEVRFVEDFINAFIEFKKDVDILNDDIQGRPGFDDYAPINPLETHLNSEDYFLTYKEIQSGQLDNGHGFWKLIGERMIISLDHSYTQPGRIIRGFNQARYYPNPTGSNDNPSLSTTPLLKNSQNNEDFIRGLATIDAYNLLNTIEKSELVYTVSSGQNEPEDQFIKKILDEIKKYGTLSEISDTYYYTPKDGSIRLNGSGIAGADAILIKANPHEMVQKDLFKIIDEETASQARPIEVKDDVFKEKINDYGKIISEMIPSSFNPDWEFIDKIKEQETGNINIARIDNETYKQRVPSFFSDRLFVSLDPLNSESGFWDNGANASSWLIQDDSKLIPPSSMGNWLAYDYSFGGRGDYNDTFAVHLSNFKPMGDVVSNSNPGFLSPAAAASPFVMTPLWLDNVNKFRRATGKVNPDLSTGTLIGYDSEKIQNRNLAYLYLQTLKPTPLIVRETDDNLNMDKYTYPYSIKAFNSAAGIVKAPKAWVLAMGSVLWRWKCFVGKTNNKWNNPLKQNNPDVPNGFDPLAQPGFNTYILNDVRTDVKRNIFVDYLQYIYSTTNLSIGNVQKSVFNSDGYSKKNGCLAKNETSSFWNSRFAFDYYNIYQQDPILTNSGNDRRIENTITTGSTVYGKPKSPVSNTAAYWSSNYGWPQLWIAPHHIPYIHPISICANSKGDDDENDASYFTVLSQKSYEYIDYQTMMPIVRGGSTIGSEWELTKYGRSFTNDGNLGYIMMNLPDVVKEEFVRVFEEWVDNEWKKEILPIVDPANFGTANDKMISNYEVKKDKDKPVINIPTQDAVFQLKDDKDLVRDKLLSQKYVIINSTPKMWLGIDESNISNQFQIEKSMVDTYLRAFKIAYDAGVQDRVKKINEKQDGNDENGDVLGNTLLDDEDVKLSLYRGFKSMVDKWFSTDKEGRMFFNVTEDLTSGYCNKSSGQTVGKNGKTTLAAHFQYVSRTMVDVGGEAVIDITKLNELKDNLKISLYQYLSDVLTENNYLFFPLPTYINFGTNGMKTEDLLDMFRPSMTMKDVSCGPLFLSMYVGGNSRVLNVNNFGGKVNCPIDLDALTDDGFDLSTGRNTPEEFKSPGDDDPGITAFRIVYGLENQNHFKNIQLDQADFGETNESLLVIDKLTKQGGTDQASKGGNLHNVYLTRSYTCHVESLGNIMIQPMTYFDLFGVPMFNGTYLITEVKHNFKPNHATTSFKGVRQPIATVPIIKDAAIVMNMSLKDIKASENRKSIKDARARGGVTKAISGGGVSPNGFNLYPDISKDILKLFGNPVLCKNKPTLTSQVFRSGGSYHGGIDIGFGNPDGGSGSYTSSADVISAYDGVVLYAGAASRFGAPPNGGWVVIRYGQNGGDTPFSDGNYYFYVYGHVNPAPGIVPNVKVTKGQIIGKAVHPTNNGSQSTGLHLHLNVLQLKTKSYVCEDRDCPGKIDPSPFLNQQENCISNVLDPVTGPGDSVIASQGLDGVGSKSKDKLTGVNASPPVGQQLNYLGKI